MTDTQRNKRPARRPLASAFAKFQDRLNAKK